MENGPSRDTASNLDSQDIGVIDHFLDALNRHKHPFVLVGNIAHRWMGCPSAADEGFDIVLRTGQLNVIVAHLIETGHWALFDSHRELELIESKPFGPARPREDEELLRYCCDADVVLRQVDLAGFRFEYVRVWSEDAYRINVDDCSFVEVPGLHPWMAVLVEKEHHPAIHRDDGWWYGPRTLD